MTVENSVKITRSQLFNFRSGFSSFIDNIIHLSSFLYILFGFILKTNKLCMSVESLSMIINNFLIYFFGNLIIPKNLHIVDGNFGTFVVFAYCKLSFSKTLRRNLNIFLRYYPICRLKRRKLL